MERTDVLQHLATFAEFEVDLLRMLTHDGDITGIAEALPAETWPVPNVGCYDELLPSRRGAAK